MLVGLFKKKQQVVMIKAFQDIKLMQLYSKKRITISDKNVLAGTTRRTNLNTSHAKYDANHLHVPINNPAR